MRLPNLIAILAATLLSGLCACGGDTIVITGPADAGDDASSDAIDTPDPDAVDPDVADPDAVDPDVADPDAADPDAADPDVADPDVADAEDPDVDPDATTPDVADDATDTTDATTPDVSDDATDTTDATTPDVSDDATDTTDATTPDVSDDATDTSDAPDTTDTTDTSDTTDTDTGPTDPLVTFCADIPRSPNGCEAELGANGWLFEGDVLLADERLIGGQVVVDAFGEIVCAACDCTVALLGLEPSILRCGGQAISPGLINAHDHLSYSQLAPAVLSDVRYDHRHQWREGFDGLPQIVAQAGGSRNQVSLAELRQLAAGTTAVAGSGGASGLVRNLDRDELELGIGNISYQTFPLSDADGERLASSCDYPALPIPSADTCFHAHVAEGVSQEAYNEFICLSTPLGVDVAEPNAAFVQMIAADALAGATLAANGTAHIWSPRSNIALYGHTAPVGMFHRQNVRIALGTDWVVTGSANILRELACADSYNQTYLDAVFSDRELWLMTTAWAADAMNISGVVGELSAGARADISIFAVPEGGDPYRAILQGSEASVLAVFVGGDPMLVDTTFASPIAAELDACETISVCGATKRVCVERELGLSFSALTASAGFAYPVFACDAPADEPTCTPARTGEFTGIPSANDPDGDGVTNEEDNCQRVFNPVRPVDGERQADADLDGQGDACDVCPLDPFTETCTTVDPDDLDSDGVDDDFDNCPIDFNADQADADTDGLGDVCDPCPAFSDSSGACLASIYEIKGGLVPEFTRVAVEGVVTAVGPTGLFMQVADDERDSLLGAAFSGIFVFTGERPFPFVGERVRISAIYENFFGQAQLNGVSSIDLVAGPTTASVTSVRTTEAVTNGAAWEGVLLNISGTVTAYDPPAGGGDVSPNNEYVLNDELRVNDFLQPGASRPALGARVRVTGPLRFGNNDFKIEPRDAGDVEVISGGAARLVAVTPDFARVPFGATSGAATAPAPWRVVLDAPAGVGGATISLTASAGDGLSVASTVTVLEGATSADIPLTTSFVSGSIGTLTASLGADVVTSEFYVYNPFEAPQIVRVAPDPVLLNVGDTAMITVELSQPATDDVTSFTITDGRVELIGSVSANAGQTSVDLTLWALAGPSASFETLRYGVTSGYELLVEIADVVPAPDLRLSEIFVNPQGADDGLEWVEIYNAGSTSVDLSGFSLGWGGVDYTFGAMSLVGTLGAGECFVVGGPDASEFNANPIFDLVQSFTPNMQNAGSAADGVGLFEGSAESITAASVPLDSVVYGDVNSNLLWQTSGALGPDVGTPASGEALARQLSGLWALGAATPNNCRPWEGTRSLP